MINENVRAFLIDLARKDNVERITIQELSNRCHLAFDTEKSGIYRSQMRRILYDISLNEFDHNRPILSALVIDIDDKGQEIFFEQVTFAGSKSRLISENFLQVCFNHCTRFWREDFNYFQYRSLTNAK